MRRVEFFFDFGSPMAYLAYMQLPGIAVRAGAEIVYRPMLLGGVFKATGNSPPAAVPAKGRYMSRDIERFARRSGVPYAFNPHFPVNTLHLMRGAMAAEEMGQFKPYADAVYRAMWVEQKAMEDLEVTGDVLARAGLDAPLLMSLVAEARIKDKLRLATEEAVARGVFGAPTFFVGAEMFFGQDRLDFVAEALAA